MLPLYLVPLASKNEVLLAILIFTFILGILAVGFNIIFGYAGQLTMFHAAAFGIGGLRDLPRRSRKLGIPFWLAAVADVCRHPCSVAARGLGMLPVPLAGVLFAVVTLAFSELARLVVLNWNSVTNGTLGMLVLEKPRSGFLAAASSRSTAR